MMTPWDKVRGDFLKKLEETESLLGRGDALARLVPEHVPREKCKQLASIRQGVNRQLQKLRLDEFHVAVVGLEKAGKSTFFNAWLRSDILPSKDARCTFTTTEIRSAASDTEQRLVIRYHTQDAFESILKDYRQHAQQPGQDGENARKDLESIERDRAALDALLGQPERVDHFADLTQAAELLWQVVATEPQARAVALAQLYSPQLSGRKGIVFHDVPGYDSPTRLHKQLAREELQRADAIVFVTNVSSHVSLTEGVLAMLDVVDKEDPNIKVADKLFVFLNHADRIQNRREFDRRIKNATKEWCEGRARCRPDRIVAGSAGMHLRKYGTFLQPDTQQMLEGAAYGFKPVPPDGDGIERMKELIEEYLEHQRAEVVARRCKALIADAERVCGDIRASVDGHFPDSVESISRTSDERVALMLMEMVDTTWEQFNHDIQHFYNTEIAPVSDDPNIPTPAPVLNTIREEFNAQLDQFANEGLTGDFLNKAWMQAFAQVADPTQADLHIRKEIADLAYQKLEDLNMVLVDGIFAIFESINQRVVELVKVPGLEQAAFPYKDVELYRAQLIAGFRSLFLRTARPATAVLLTKPHGTPARALLLQRFRADVGLLEHFYSGERSGLARYIERGLDGSTQAKSAVAKAASAAVGVVGVAGSRPVAAAARAAKPTFDELLDASPQTSPLASTKEVVMEQLRSDWAVLFDWLKHSVYAAAGFEGYCMQELERIRRHLRSNAMKAAIREAMSKAVYHYDPTMAKLHRSSAGELERTRRVVEAISQFDQVSLRRAQS